MTRDSTAGEGEARSKAAKPASYSWEGIARVAPNLPREIVEQMRKAGLPIGGQHPFEPRLVENRRGEQVIVKQAILHGPKQGKKGFVDLQGRMWIRDRAHADVPDHWDVQLDGGRHYRRIDLHGNELT